MHLSASVPGEGFQHHGVGERAVSFAEVQGVPVKDRSDFNLYSFYFTDSLSSSQESQGRFIT